MLGREDRQKAREEAAKFQAAITEGWKEVAAKYPGLIEDFVNYSDGLAAMYRNFANEQAIGKEKLDDHEVVQYLQRAKQCDIVKTYITSRIDQDVAQPIKNSK